MITDSETLQALRNARPDYYWKTQTASEWGATLVAYIDARQVMDILDDIVGPARWQRRHKEVGGVVYCSIDILFGNIWISKEDAGSESSMEAEKGQSSDAFKRAAVNWGIGRFLYDLDVIRIKETIKNNKGKWVPASGGSQIWDINEYVFKHGLDKNKTPATDQQRSSIQALAKQAGLSGQDFLDWLSGKVYGAKWKSLTFIQATEAIRCLSEQAADVREIGSNAA